MNIKAENNDIILSNVQDFNLEHIFDCGQTFRFNKTDDNTYTGVAFGRALTLTQNDDEVILFDTSYEDFKNIWYDYFDFSTDYSQIKEKVGVDEFMKEAADYGSGIRILKQDIFEMIISFIISASNNVPRIKGIVERLCENFGEEISYMGKTYHTFPTIEKMSQLSVEDLSVIRAGFRDRYIIDAVTKIKNGVISLDKLKKMSREEAKETLMQINGIGNKVSDCILLFGLGHTNAFPIDVWIKRIMEYCYFEKEQSVKTISDLAEEKFGDLSGYAQQYLFFWAREKKIGV